MGQPAKETPVTIVEVEGHQPDAHGMRHFVAIATTPEQIEFIKNRTNLGSSPDAAKNFATLVATTVPKDGPHAGRPDADAVYMFTLASNNTSNGYDVTRAFVGILPAQPDKGRNQPSDDWTLESRKTINLRTKDGKAFPQDAGPTGVGSFVSPITRAGENAMDQFKVSEKEAARVHEHIEGMKFAQNTASASGLKLTEHTPSSSGFNFNPGDKMPAPVGGKLIKS